MGFDDRTEEEIEELEQAMRDKVVGEVVYGQPVEVHYNWSRPKRILTYFGWFRSEHRILAGEMEVCDKVADEDAEEGFVLTDVQRSSLNPDQVEKIVPLTPDSEKSGGETE